MFIPTDPLFHVLWLSFSAAVTAALAVYAVRHRRVQGAHPFVGLMASFAFVSLFHLLGLFAYDPRWRVALNDVRWTWTALLPLFWLLFALEYTGNDELTSPRAVRALAAIPAVTILLVWTNDWHGLMWTHDAVVVVEGLAIMDLGLGPWFWVWTAYMYAAGFVGSFLLLRLVWASEYLFTDQSILLVVGVAAPLAASVVTTFELVPNLEPALDLAPYSFGVTGVAFGYALYRRQLFDLVPATRELGRTSAIRQLEDGLAIVDTARRFVYLNPAAGSIVDRDPESALGRSIEETLDDVPVAFGTTDALAEIDRDGRVYEVRSSPIDDRRGRLVGHTLVFHDVTERERRERQLVRQRHELETVNQLNAVIRGVNQALVSTRKHDDVLDAVCTRLADSDLYETAIAADLPTWRGDADRWTSRGSDRQIDRGRLPALFDDHAGDEKTAFRTRIADGGGPGRWTVVPIVFGRAPYGALALFTHRETISTRERDVLLELGELVGHAIDAVENRQLLSGETFVEVELESDESDAALAAVTDRVDCRIDLAGVVPASDDGVVAYLEVQRGPADRVREALEDYRGGAVRTIGRDEPVVEWAVARDDLLGTLYANGARVSGLVAERGTVRFTVELPSDADVRSLLERLRESFTGTQLISKRTHEGPIEPIGSVLEDAMVDLTERQREALEAAYRAGYFDWPRESTAEEVADALGISAPTFHGHLRKAERSVIDELFRNGDAG